MSSMGDGYVGTAQDAVRSGGFGNGQPVLLQFGSSTYEILETAFKKETVGLVTREEYVEKRVNIRTTFEEEEKLQKLQQEEEELQLQNRKKRKIKGTTRLSFADKVEGDRGWK